LIKLLKRIPLCYHPSTMSSPSKIASPSSEEMSSKASELLMSGRRHLNSGNFQLAASLLSQACGLYSKVHGETDPLCGGAYLDYGIALLELAKMENEVLSYSLEGLELQASSSPSQDEMVESPEKVPEEEKPDVVKIVGEAIEENFLKFEKIAKLHCLYDGEESSEDEEDMVSEQSPSKAAVSSPSKEMETAEDVSNLEVAWEMLEMARIVFIKQAAASQGAEKVVAESKVCSALLALGEVSHEGGEFMQAEEDVSSCLAKRKEILPADSRSIAETLFVLAMIQAALGKDSEAEASLVKAIAVLKDRAGNIGKMEVSGFMAQELEDLDIIVAEIEEKIAQLKGKAVTEVEGQESKMSSSPSKRKMSSSPSKLQDGSKAPRLDLQAAVVGGSSGPGAL